jgi:TonB family protein
MPIVPPIAKQAHLAGRVVIELTVAEDGSVAKSEVVSGNPILGQAASRAGKSWTFKPFNGADGKPAQALVKLTFDFEAR